MTNQLEIKEEALSQPFVPENGEDPTHQLVLQLMSDVELLRRRVSALESEVAELRGRTVPADGGINGEEAIIGALEILDNFEESKEEPVAGPSGISEINEIENVADQEPEAGPSGLIKSNINVSIEEITEQADITVQQNVELPENSPVTQNHTSDSTASNSNNRKRQPKASQNTAAVKRIRKSFNLNQFPIFSGIKNKIELCTKPDEFIEKIIKTQHEKAKTEAVAKRHAQVEKRIRDTLEIRKGSSFQFEVFGLKNAGLGNGSDLECFNIFLCNVSVSSEIQGIDDAKILELMKGKPNYFKDPVSDDLSVTFVNVDSKVSQTYRLFNGDNLSGRLCYAYWKVVEYFMELQPALHKLFIFFSHFFDAAGSSNPQYKLNDRDEIVSGMVLFYLQHYHIEKKLKWKWLLYSFEKYFKHTNFDVEKFLQGGSGLLVIRRLNQHGLESTDFKKHIVDCVKFWTNDRPIKDFLYDTWSGLWIRRGRDQNLQQVPIISSFGKNDLKFVISKENFEGFETVLEFLERAVQNVNAD